MSGSYELLRRSIEPGRHTDEEINELIARSRSLPPGRPLESREYLTITMPGVTIRGLGKDVVLASKGNAMDDEAIRLAAQTCSDLWVDARWYPAGLSGIHLLVLKSLSVDAPEGLSVESAGLFNVPADDATFDFRDASTVRFVRLSWKLPTRRPVAIAS